MTPSLLLLISPWTHSTGKMGCCLISGASWSSGCGGGGGGGGERHQKEIWGEGEVENGYFITWLHFWALGKVRLGWVGNEYVLGQKVLSKDMQLKSRALFPLFITIFGNGPNSTLLPFWDDCTRVWPTRWRVNEEMMELSNDTFALILRDASWVSLTAVEFQSDPHFPPHPDFSPIVNLSSNVCPRLWGKVCRESQVKLTICAIRSDHEPLDLHF